MPASRIYNPFVGSGGGGGGGVTPAQLAVAEEVRTFAFDFSTPSQVIFQIPAGARIVSTSVNMEIPFNGVGALIQIGDAGDSDRLMPTANNSVYEADSFIAHVPYTYVAATNISFTKTNGSETVGSGYIAITYNLNN